mmetsp:Transcript_81705/g.170994  ORF Transcript_81705/g.170994 Transcript_81705/m.170994 type:complete len:210 (-) Transcript_81705:667-1296(-)
MEHQATCEEIVNVQRACRIVAHCCYDFSLCRLLLLQLLFQSLKVLAELHLAAQAPGILSGGSGLHHARVAHHGLLLQFVRFAVAARLDQSHKLGKLDSVGVLVALREAPLGRRHQMPVNCRKLHMGSHLILRREHALRSKNLDALVVAIGRISAGVGHSHDPALVLGQNCDGVQILQLGDLGVVAMTHGCDGLRHLSSGQPLLHVEVVD